jgi:hypothetical protein
MARIGQAYNNMNKFLTAFLDHVRKPADFCREKIKCTFTYNIRVVWFLGFERLRL